MFISSNINGLIVNHPGDATGLALKLLVENCVRLQEYERAYCEQSFLRNCCTVRMMTSRRAGHTTAAKMIMERFSSPQLVCVNELQRRNAIENGVKAKQCVATIGTLTRLKGMNKVDAIIVDSLPSDSRYLQDNIKIPGQDCAILHWEQGRQGVEDKLYDIAASIRNRDFPFCMIFIGG